MVVDRPGQPWSRALSPRGGPANVLGAVGFLRPSVQQPLVRGASGPRSRRLAPWVRSASRHAENSGSVEVSARHPRTEPVARRAISTCLAAPDDGTIAYAARRPALGRAQAECPAKERGESDSKPLDPAKVRHGPRPGDQEHAPGDRGASVKVVDRPPQLATLRAAAPAWWRGPDRLGCARDGLQDSSTRTTATCSRSA